MELFYEPTLRERVLSLDPFYRGFGFAVLESGPTQIADWGIRHCGKVGSRDCAVALQRMIARYAPSAIVTEDLREARTLRARSLRVFITGLSDAADEASVKLRTYARADVRAVFEPAGAITKEQIANVLIARFPELESRRPPPRKVWESEDSRMAIFDALSFAVTHFVSGDG